MRTCEKIISKQIQDRKELLPSRDFEHGWGPTSGTPERPDLSADRREGNLRCLSPKGEFAD
jgi:hypothetical protein